MSLTNLSFKNLFPQITANILFILVSFFSMSTIHAQSIVHEGISMRIPNIDYEKVKVFDPESFNEVLIVMLKDKEGKDIGTVTLSRVNFEERTTVPSDQDMQTKVMQNRKNNVTKMDKGVGNWTFKKNVKIDQHKAQYFELDSKIARAGQLFLIETTKDQILIKFVYKNNIDENLVRNFKDWITNVKVLLNQSPRKN